MKKFTMILMMLGFGCSLFAQRVENSINLPSNNPFSPGYTGQKMAHFPDMKSESKSELGMNKYYPVSAWYDFVGSFAVAQANGGFDLNKNVFSAITWPDTFVKIIYINATTSAADPQYSNWCSWGTSFDATDSIFSNDGDANDALAAGKSYTVDSVEYLYTYTRKTDTSVVDTIVFQATKIAPANGFVFTDPTTHQVIQRIGTVDYDIAHGIAANMDMTIKIPLRKTDTSTAVFAVLKRELGFTCNPGEFTASTVTFKPGKSYAANDTIADFLAADTSANKPSKKFNTLRLLVDEDLNATQNRPLRPNNGLVVNQQQRYLATWFQSPTLSSKYIAATGFGVGGNTALYPRALYHVTGSTGTGINNTMKDGYGLGDIYPNPSNGIANIQFAIGKPGNISIQILDILGRNVMTAASGNYTSGSHNVSINTEGMKPGIYFYTFTTNGYTQTKKFTVVQ